MPDRLLLDLHIHSVHSYDGMLHPRQIVQAAERRGLDGIAITDHDSTASFEALDSLSARSSVMIVPGVEVKSDRGDVIGLFVKTAIADREFFKVVDEIHRQGGIAVLPHPYRGRHCDPEELATVVDLIEVANARCRDRDNIRASQLASRHGKPGMAGSDAHWGFEIGGLTTSLHGFTRDVEVLRDMLLKSSRDFVGRCTPYYLSHGLSFGVSRIRKCFR